MIDILKILYHPIKGYTDVQHDLQAGFITDMYVKNEDIPDNHLCLYETVELNKMVSPPLTVVFRFAEEYTCYL